jgi:hypothetical protein
MTTKTFIILASGIKTCVHITEVHKEREVPISDIVSYKQNALSNPFRNFYFKNLPLMVYFHSNT